MERVLLGIGVRSDHLIVWAHRARGTAALTNTLSLRNTPHFSSGRLHKRSSVSRGLEWRFEWAWAAWVQASWVPGTYASPPLCSLSLYNVVWWWGPEVLTLWVASRSH